MMLMMQRGRRTLIMLCYLMSMYLAVDTLKLYALYTYADQLARFDDLMGQEVKELLRKGVLYRTKILCTFSCPIHFLTFSL
jgi:hypothetical protein